MSVFVRKDPRVLACREPSWAAAVFAMLWRHIRAAAALLLLAVALYAANVWLGLHAAAQTSGSLDGLPVAAPITIARDARGIPHIRAGNAHDLFFAQGFAEASDRLFEMDLTRRYAYGRLAEVFGARALPIDENMRAADIAALAQREWNGTGAQTRLALQAFSDGVNAAESHEPLPVEFRLVLYKPERWTPQDSIAVSLVAALELGDAWNDVLERDSRMRALGARCYAAAFPLSDPRYDVTVDGRFVRGASGDARACDTSVALRGAQDDKSTRLGSNAWAAGAQRTADHHALIANDPHVDLTIPGIWYVVDLQAPGIHVAGAVIPGLPGVVLGHNDRIAWAVTNAEVSTDVLYRVPEPPQRDRVVERFNVRFGVPVTKAYYRTRDAFSISAGEDDDTYFVRWPQYTQNASTIPTLLALDRAQSVAGAMRTLSRYRGAPQNFIVADSSGAVAYHLAGAIFNDPAWGRYVHPQTGLSQRLHVIPFDDLPAHAPSRSAVLLSANNKMYGRSYPYRLSAEFEVPYRAYRIGRLLHARKAYDVAYFERMQLDTCSPIDAEIARDITDITREGTLARWDGCFQPRSRVAAVEHEVRDDLLQQSASFATLLARLRYPSFNARNGIDENAAAALDATKNERRTWARTGRVDVQHPLSPAWYGLLSGASLPGDGDEFSIHLQEPGFAQGFRAVWDVGNWDAGGIVLPSGESGEPGSGHYDDAARTWIGGKLVPLAFSDRAVERVTTNTLILR